ncbi:MAG: radical SAM family heme chaperone HemW [Aquificaceae bacterium]|nr:radical SAM family heme chaperone HemW [Aquificaceae bacterium]
MVKGLYFHVPFCSYKCPYCDFVSVVDAPVSHEEYFSLLLKELSLYQDLNFYLKTLYFGGGTPSSVSPVLYEKFLGGLSTLVDLSRVEEVTIECNPESYGLEDFRILRSLGFNRVSIGVQSLREEGLKTLGRKHSVRDAIMSIKNAQKAGFENINIDLIYGYPGQGLEELKEEIEILSCLGVSHVSFYLLTPYEDTQFGQLYQRGLLSLPDQDTLADMYQLICESLESMGFLHYEISNFALPGFECKHNLIYWTHEEFLGLGVSAWSFVQNERFGNTRNIKLYIHKVKQEQKPIEYWEKLKDKEKIYDYIFVALRTSLGVDKNLIPQLPEELEEFFIEEKGKLKLNRRGMLLINEILLKLRQEIFT